MAATASSAFSFAVIGADSGFRPADATTCSSSRWHALMAAWLLWPEPAVVQFRDVGGDQLAFSPRECAWRVKQRIRQSAETPAVSGRKASSARIPGSSSSTPMCGICRSLHDFGRRLATDDWHYFARSENQAGDRLLSEPLDGAGNRIRREVSIDAAAP